MNPYLKLIRLDKPIGTLLILWPTLTSLLVAYKYHPPLLIVLVFIIEAFLTRSFGCAINDYFDHKFDKLVLRTKDRPIPAGLIKPSQALILGLSLMLLAFVIAVTTLAPRTIIASFIVLGLICTYPLTKRFFSIPQLYLAITWSSGIILAFTQAGNITENWFICLILVLINLAWVLAFDTIYALVDEKYDKLLNIKSSALFFNQVAVPIVKSLYFFYISFLIYIGGLLHLTWPYFLCLLFVLLTIFRLFRLINRRDPNECFVAFLMNNRIGYLVFAGFLTQVFNVVH